MHAIFSYTVLFIFLGASVAYGGDCTSNQCTDTATECISDACECVITHFRNTADDACQERILAKLFYEK